MSDSLRLYIHESSAERCVAKGLHRSGARVRPISFNDILYGSDNETPCGIVASVEPERVDRENWLYRVSYVPAIGTLHPVDSFVVWRQPVNESQPVVPHAIAQRIQQPSAPSATVPNGRKRTKRQSVNGQHGKAEQASEVDATATV